jgi:type VI protein secretion system component VasK
MRHKRGSALASMLAVVVIILILVMVWLYYGQPNKGSGEQGEGQPLQSRVSQTRQAAESVECRNSLSQIRQAIQMQKMDDETQSPASLADLKLPDSVLKCPISGQPYQYDLNSGTVRCNTPGHMSY